MDYFWESIGCDIVSLHHGFGFTANYTRDSLTQAIEITKNGRHMYATDEAWQTSLDMFESGLQYFC